MKPQQLVAWFEEIEGRVLSTTPATSDSAPLRYYYDNKEVAKWRTDAESALYSVFPETHAVVRNFHKSLEDINKTYWFNHCFEGARAVFTSALEQLRGGRLVGIARSLQGETVGELLDHAESLLSASSVAAMVVAGGALETHLRHLCTQNGLTWNGDGSISKYDQAIAQHRNSGTGPEVYSSTDTKLVTGWGALRNDAAHNPGTFQRSKEEIRIAIEGVRHFLARTV